MLQVNREFYNQAMLKQLEEKLASLRQKLYWLETAGEQEITQRRVAADMGDDYRENEGAKHVMEQHDIWYIRKVALKKEIAQLKKEIAYLKQV